MCNQNKKLPQINNKKHSPKKKKKMGQILEQEHHKRKYPNGQLAHKSGSVSLVITMEVQIKATMRC